MSLTMDSRMAAWEGELLHFGIQREFIIDVFFLVGNPFLCIARCCMDYVVDVLETSVCIGDKNGRKQV